jgi:hypothetical protein
MITWNLSKGGEGRREHETRQKEISRGGPGGRSGSLVRYDDPGTKSSTRPAAESVACCSSPWQGAVKTKSRIKFSLAISSCRIGR